MRKSRIIALSLAIAVSAVGLGAGVSLAAGYISPSDSTVYTFGNPNDNFQQLSYYFDSGDGTSGSPFIIKNSQQLRNLSKLYNLGILPNATYASLGTSFQYEGAALEPIGTASRPFVGVFNGDSHAISKLVVSTNAVTDVGMFGVVGSSAAKGTVYDLVLVGPSVSYTGTSAVNIGLVAGRRDNTQNQGGEIKQIEIYGGTESFDKVRAHLYSGGNATCSNVIVGNGGPSATSGFVANISDDPTFVSTASYTSGISKNKDCYFYHNGTNVVKTEVAR